MPFSFSDFYAEAERRQIRLSYDDAHALYYLAFRAGEEEGERVAAARQRSADTRLVVENAALREIVKLARRLVQEELTRLGDQSRATGFLKASRWGCPLDEGGAAKARRRAAGGGK